MSPSSAEPRDKSPGVETADDLQALQDLLFGEERAELVRLRKQIDALGFDAEHLSRLLPEAVALRSRRDQKLGKALMPTVEEAVRQSVSRNPKPLADAIFPVIGPAIRKAVGQAFSGMVQALNSALEHSLSYQGLKWRIEAARTGVPFAQIVLRHTLLYRVEQVFLIHRETGLLLSHLAAPGTEGQDPDMVSGMLSAIQDFVADSFKVKEGAGLQTFRVGELLVRVEHGPHALLAAAVRGQPPNDLVHVFQDALEEVHLEFREQLASFDGDVAPFIEAEGTLQPCLVTELQTGQERRGLSPALKVGLAAIALGLLAWLFFHVRADRRWNRAVELLKAEPGVTVVEADRRGGRYVVAGLRDVLATDPMTIIGESRVPIDEVDATFTPFLSFEAPFVEQRATQILAPPESVSLVFDGGTIRAVGSASDGWISAAREAVRMIPGVTVFDTDRLVNVEMQAIRDLESEIERLRVQFPVGSARLTRSQDSVLSVAVVRIQRLQSAATRIGRTWEIELLGRTDEGGSSATNVALSRSRADAVLQALVVRGLAREGLTVVGLGASDPLAGASADETTRINRSVSFRVTVNDPAPVAGRPR